MKRKQKIFLSCLITILLFCAAYYLLFGQAKPDFKITGIVSDAQTGLPIPGATVSDSNYGSVPFRSTTSDASGQYHYTTWPEEHLIVAKAEGYIAESKTIKDGLFQKQESKKVDFQLYKKSD